MSGRPLVLYHANCSDGFCAAWVARRYFGRECDFVPVQYGQEPPDVTGRDLYILDFSYKRPVMEKMVRDAAEIVVLDHHKTAQTEFDGLGDYAIKHGTPHRFVFDMDKSGGRLAWEQFNGDRPSPWLVDYTEDRDLWRWALPQSREISAALASYPHTFEQWDEFYFRYQNDGLTEKIGALPHPLRSLADQGAAILRYQQTVVDSHCRFAREIELDGHKVLSVNATSLVSEIAGKLAEGRPFGACWFVREDGKQQWSLRSRDGGIDVSEVAKRRGGGGHRNAAGFEV